MISLTQGDDNVKKFLIGLLSGFIIAAGVSAALYFTLEPGADKGRRADQNLLDAAIEAANCISLRDYEGLSKMVHPEYGVVFSPYSNISLASDKCFTPSQVAAFGSDSASYVWGTYDGSGEPIEMTPADYFNTFVYNANYASAPVLGINYIVKYGNSLENVSDVFPDGLFVDFHFPALSDNLEGADWCTLRLVFEEYDGVLMLTAVIHCQMTV